MIPHSCPDIGQKEAEAVKACLESLQVKGGARVRELERTVARALGYADGVATTRGGQAIRLALALLFPGGKARVGVPSYICRSVYDATVLAGCDPILLDVDPTHFAPAREHVSRADLDALIVAHMFGIPAPMEEYLGLGLPIIEDCAQRISLGQEGRTAQKGTVRMLSFEATKLLTCGEGGMLLVDQPDWAERARKLRDGPYDLREPALWLPMTDIQAAVAIVQWGRLPEFLEKRRRLAEFYLNGLGPHFARRIHPAMRFKGNVFFRFLLQVADPDAFIQAGAERGVAFRRPVAPCPLHELYEVPGDFPVTEHAMRQIVSIPLYPRLTEEEARTVLLATVWAIERSLHDPA